MKKAILNHQMLKAISRVMTNYPQVFEDKPEAIAMKNLFNQQLDEASAHISKLLRPISTVHRPKQELQKHFITETQKMIGMGTLLATHLGNESLVDLLKYYNRQIRSIAAFKQYELAVHVTEELEPHISLADEFGLSEQKLQAFRELTEEFGDKLENTGIKLEARRSKRFQIDQILKACNLTLRTHIDPFVRFHQKEFPLFYDDYKLIRGFPRKRKRSYTQHDQVEILGTVTDAATGLPVHNATINLLGFEISAETDIDGYYLIDDLPATKFIVSCFKQGYNIPDQLTIEASKGESLLVDFTLDPVSASAAQAA